MGSALDRNPPEGLRAWPRPVKTDDQGRFTLPGLGRGVSVILRCATPAMPGRTCTSMPRSLGAARRSTLALEPARIIEGRVLAADTGRPIPNAIVSATTRSRTSTPTGIFTAKFRADAQGRFMMNPIAGEIYTVGAFPTGGEPYLIQQDELNWTKGAIRATHDIKSAAAS